MNKIKAYLSHPIRGKLGNDATDEYMQANNEKAKRKGNGLCIICPELELYIPAEMDDFLIPKGISPVSVVTELLALDCAIIKQCDVILVYNHVNHISGGMQIEIAYAKEHDIPIIIFDDAVDSNDVIRDIKFKLNK